MWQCPDYSAAGLQMGNFDTNHAAWAANDGGELRVWPTESVTGGGSAASVTNDANGRPRWSSPRKTAQTVTKSHHANMRT